MKTLHWTLQDLELLPDVRTSKEIKHLHLPSCEKAGVSLSIKCILAHRSLARLAQQESEPHDVPNDLFFHPISYFAHP